jgi:hypothetical protein
MSEESRPHGKPRPLKREEKALLTALLTPLRADFQSKISSCLVEDMNDGGMGSLKFINSGESEIRSLGRSLAEAQYTDEDGVPVSIVVNADKNNELYELDFWKVDFSPLRRYPKPEQLIIKIKKGASGEA